MLYDGLPCILPVQSQPFSRSQDRQGNIFVIFPVCSDKVIHPVIPPCHILHTVLKVFPFLSKRIPDVLFRYGENRYQAEDVFHDNICPFCVMCFLTDDIKQIRYRRCRYTCKNLLFPDLPE